VASSGKSFHKDLSKDEKTLEGKKKLGRYRSPVGGCTSVALSDALLGYPETIGTN